DVDGRAVELRALTAARRVHLAAHRLVDDARRQHAVLLERDQHRPVRNTAREVPRAIDGVDDEAAPLAAAGAGFLGEHAVLWIRTGEDGEDGALGFAVGDGHGGAVVLDGAVAT